MCGSISDSLRRKAVRQYEKQREMYSKELEEKEKQAKEEKLEKRKAARREWYKKNSEEIREYAREWYRKNNKKLSNRIVPVLQNTEPEIKLPEGFKFEGHPVKVTLCSNHFRVYFK